MLPKVTIWVKIMNTKALAAARALLDAGLMLRQEHKIATRPLLSIAAGLRLGRAESEFQTACRKFGQRECFGALAALWLEKELAAFDWGYHLIPFDDRWTSDMVIMGAIKAMD
jgi:hypothetical protein